jgi:ectoine hydroxylase-related dioxygenase (phytanoyl-CoA dioxygenase family)
MHASGSVAPAAAADLIGAGDLAHYRLNGFLVTGLVLPEDVLAAAEAAFARFRKGERDRQLPLTARLFDRAHADDEPLAQYGYLAIQMDAFLRLARHPFIAASAALLAGTEEIRLFHDRMIIKHPAAHQPADRSSIGWHTDRAYWRTCSSNAMLTAWVPFQDCSPEIGTLMVMEGSHRWDGNDWMATSHDGDMDRLERQVQTGSAPIRKVAYAVRRGQVSFHHCRTVHGSGPNTTSRARTSLSIHLQDGANRYAPHVDAAGRKLGHTNDLLCRSDQHGHPDYGDPEVFPVLWRA